MDWICENTGRIISRASDAFVSEVLACVEGSSK